MKMKMIEDEPNVTVQITKSGEQIVMMHPAGVVLGIETGPDDPVASSITVPMSTDAREYLSRKAMTNDISAAMLKNIEKKIVK